MMAYIIINNDKFYWQVTDEYSSLVVAQLLYLQSEDHNKPINMYINSPGTAHRPACIISVTNIQESLLYSVNRH